MLSVLHIAGACYIMLYILVYGYGYLWIYCMYINRYFPFFCPTLPASRLVVVKIPPPPFIPVTCGGRLEQDSQPGPFHICPPEGRFGNWLIRAWLTTYPFIFPTLPSSPPSFPILTFLLVFLFLYSQCWPPLFP